MHRFVKMSGKTCFKHCNISGKPRGGLHQSEFWISISMYRTLRACVKFTMCHLWIMVFVAERWRLPGEWVCVLLLRRCVYFWRDMFCWLMKVDGVCTGNFPRLWLWTSFYSLSATWRWPNTRLLTLIANREYKLSIYGIILSNVRLSGLFCGKKWSWLKKTVRSIELEEHRWCNL